MSTTSNPPLQLLPLSTSISPSFWHALTSLKLHSLKLSQQEIPITAHYSPSTSTYDRINQKYVGIDHGIELDANSFQQDDQSEVGKQETTQSKGQLRVRLKGYLKCFNTIEGFKQCDKQELMQQLGQTISQQLSSTTSDGIKTTLESLNPFLMICFADLKKYRYYYWTCFPTIVQKPGWEISDGEGWKEMEMKSFAEEIPRPEGGICIARPKTPLNDQGKEEENDLEYGPMSNHVEFWKATPSKFRTIVYSDPSSHPTAPGWTLRNCLSYLSARSSSSFTSISTPNTTEEESSSFRLILLRGGENSPTCLSTRIQLKKKLQESITVEAQGKEKEKVIYVGWEKNEKGTLGPRMADLGPLMDPTRLADQAVDLNLQLMKWRILPDLDLDKVKTTKCLLLGSGTLGCYVARCLMAWGVRKITLVDSSTVSFSNPVRQPLFEFEDSLNGGKPKAEAAAESLKRIYPGVDATGITLSIPMPGHPIPPSSHTSVQQDFETLEKLIEEHDVVYLGMDSRESRWLPTVIAGAKGKLVMNVALGFDTYLVMRHGLSTDSTSVKDSTTSTTTSINTPYKGKLGCYYCNDIVAPMDSLSDRTLDQMCTVTRPGLAAIASATAVELMVSVLQHPLGPNAPSDVPIVTTNSLSTNRNDIDEAAEGEAVGRSPLGEVPHQIRGFLAGFNNLKITGQAYDRCTGCSNTMLEEYRSKGFSLVREACSDAKHLERVTGLDKLEEETEKMLAEGVDWEEEGDEEEDDF